MRRTVSRALTIALAAVLSVTLAAGPAVAAATEEAPPPSADDKILDIVFLRPLGLLSTVGGTALWVVSLPFTIGSGTATAAAETLISEPVRYTFARPLGRNR